MSEGLYSYARQRSLPAANTTVVPLSQTGGDPSTSRDSGDTERDTAPVSQNKPVKMPEDGTVPVGLGPRPLVLGTFRIATPSSAASPRSRPPSSSSRAPRTPTVASARWPSYTTPLTPLSQLSVSQVSDEVKTLKAQLAASEALVKQLTKEKFEAVSASRELFADVQSLQDKQTEWLKEREELMAELGLLDEADATPGLLPYSAGVCFAGSKQTLSQVHAPLLPISRHDGDLEIPPSETYQVPEVGVGRPAASDRGHSELVVSRTDIIGDDEALARIGSIFLASTPVDDRDDCNPSSPTSTPMPVVEHATPLSTPIPRPPLNALGLPCTPDSPVQALTPSPARSVSARAQAPRPQPDLIDLASRTVGSDPCPRYPGRRDLNDGAKSFLKEVNAAAAAGSRPSFNFATGVELHAAMARVSASTARPRLASEFTKWQAISKPQIQKEAIDPLRESGFAALVRSKRKRPIPQLRARGFMPCSSPLANPPLANPSENPEEEQTRAEISQAEPASALARRGGAPLEEAAMNCLSSSPLVNPPENAKQGQSKKRRQLGKLLKRVRSWISRSA